MKFIAFLLALFLSMQSANAANVEELSKEKASWDGNEISYPEGQAEMSVVRIKLKPSEELGYHCHPVPSAAYVISGELEVSLKDGSSKIFRTGDTITEVVGRLHKGKNLSSDKGVELIVFYPGAEGKPLTYHGDEISKCHE
jgi:quercetin dioxygenase-like cupin family protein